MLTLTTLPSAHQFCAAFVGTHTACRCIFIDEVDPCLDVLLELAEGEETAVDHPFGTSFGVCLYTVLRPWRIFGYGDDVLIGLHVLILFKG